MPGKLIGKLLASWVPDAAIPPERGGGLFVARDGQQVPITLISQELREIAGPEGKPVPLEITIARKETGRSLAQNRMMWALLTLMAEAYNGGRPGGAGVSPEDCYIEMLEAASVTFEIYSVPVRSLPILRRGARICKVIELGPEDRCTVKVGAGSSTFSVRQMRDFVESIFDRLADMQAAGLPVPPAAVAGYWQDWRDSG